ncbi:hypothetical protein ANO14919_090310 [Xylariales sp. No.14919]|nr:hypothetical protein ANO14919_090310 [Xylariales sp. No.14919]
MCSASSSQADEELLCSGSFRCLTYVDCAVERELAASPLDNAPPGHGLDLVSFRQGTLGTSKRLDVLLVIPFDRRSRGTSTVALTTAALVAATAMTTE